MNDGIEGRDRSCFDSTVMRGFRCESGTLTTDAATPVLDQFEVEADPLGVGASGVVWRAKDLKLGRAVALKMPATLCTPPIYGQMIMREASITSQLEHPGIAPVFESGVEEQSGEQHPPRPYFAMRAYRGTTLWQEICEYHNGSCRRRELREELLRRIVSVCNTVGYAHSRGVIHRDLKPQNIILGDFDDTLVLDWGVAGVFDARLFYGADTDQSSHEIQEERPIGTYEFMSPEMLDEQELIGPHSDIFSLGAILYLLLTNHPVWNSPSDCEDVYKKFQAFGKIQSGDFTSPEKIKPDIPEPLAAICRRAMAKDPKERYPRAEKTNRRSASLANDIQAWLDNEPLDPNTYRDPWLVRLERWSNKRSTQARALKSSILLLLLIVSVEAGILAMKNEALTAQVAGLTSQAQQAVEQIKYDAGLLLQSSEESDADFHSMLEQSVEDPFIRGYWIWDANSLPESRPLPWVQKIAVSLEGDNVSLVSTEDSGAESSTGTDSDRAQICSISFGNDDQNILVGAGRYVCAWNVDTARAGLSWQVPTETLAAAAFRGNSKEIVAATTTGGLLSVRLDTGETEWIHREDRFSISPHDGVLSDEGGTAAWSFLTTVHIAHSGGQTSNLRDPMNGKSAVPTVVAVSIDGDRVAWSNNKGLWVNQELRSQHDAVGGAFSRSGKLLATFELGGLIRVCDLETGATKSMKNSDQPTAIGFTSNGSCVVTGNDEGAINFRDVRTGVLLLSLKMKSAVSLLQFSNDGRMLAAAGTDGRVRIWNVGLTAKQ